MVSLRVGSVSSRKDPTKWNPFCCTNQDLPWISLVCLASTGQSTMHTRAYLCPVVAIDVILSGDTRAEARLIAFLS